MFEFYFERTDPSSDLLSLNHLQSICKWEKKFKEILSLSHVPSLSLATFVALYSSKTDCQLITSKDVENFRSILHTCLPYYLNGYMDIPLSDQFLNRVVIEHYPGYSTNQEQVKAVYAALRHTCFYKNITRFIFDHFLDKKFLNNFQQSKTYSQVSISMIYIPNYTIIKYNRTRDQTMCLRRQPYSRKYCLEHGCIDDYKNNFVTEKCTDQGPPLGNCEKYCHCKYQCLNETEQVILLTPNLKGPELVEIFGKYFSGKNRLKTYKDQFIRLIALNLANVREKAAMAQIHKGSFCILERKRHATRNLWCNEIDQNDFHESRKLFLLFIRNYFSVLRILNLHHLLDMLLVTIAAALIVGITVLYLRSFSIALIIVIGATLSLGVSYFIYRVIYRIPIFPFMNLMSAFILIGIGCDDIFVFFDTWEQEKAAWLRKYQDKQRLDSKLIEILFFIRKK